MSVSLGDVSLAMRARLETVVVCTTGVMALAASGGAYTRTSGSFVADRFVVGQEVRPEGFASNAPAVVTEVSATRLMVSPAPANAGSASGRRLTVGLPALRIWSNVDRGTPDAARPFVEAEAIEQPAELISGPAQHGVKESRGLYLVRVFVPFNTGERAARDYTAAILALFQPGQKIPAGTGQVRVRGDIAPSEGALLRVETHAVVTVTIPWRVLATQTLA